MNKLTHLFEPRLRLHSTEERHRALCERIESQRAQIESLIRRTQQSDPGLAARARSLLLFQQSLPNHEIIRVTGLTSNTVLRVRRRFELWGAACIPEPQPRQHMRTSLMREAS
jgi:hypothetical protein